MIHLDFIRRAGTPAITDLGGKDLVITEPAPTTQPDPTVTPSRTVTLDPNQQFDSIRIPT